MDLARISIPTISQNLFAAGSVDRTRIADLLPRELRESSPFNECALLHHPERILLAVGRIPDIVDEEVRNIQRGEGRLIPGVCGRVMVSQV